MHTDLDPREEQALWDADLDFYRDEEDRINAEAQRPHDYLTELQTMLADGRKPTVDFWRGLYRALTYGESLASVLGPDYARQYWNQEPEADQVREYLLETGIEHELPDRTYFLLEEIKGRIDERLKIREAQVASIVQPSKAA